MGDQHRGEGVLEKIDWEVSQKTEDGRTYVRVRLHRKRDKSEINLWLDQSKAMRLIRAISDVSCDIVEKESTTK
ncbi:hypothetical protein ACMFWY_05950 [Roseiconus sp. JC912]|uniref:hypothetical protein n=1 Tax=Roseiconus sp. JC912 TaxID=3396307 RepID=UPI003A4C54FF